MTKTQFRAFLYCAIAGATVLQNMLPHCQKAQDYALLFVSIVVAVCTTLRAFLDQTQSQEEGDSAQDVPPVVPGTLPNLQSAWPQLSPDALKARVAGAPAPAGILAQPTSGFVQVAPVTTTTTDAPATGRPAQPDRKM